MSRIFISHSGQDSEAAADVRAQLRTADYQSVFLDFDPAHGIPAGRDWEQELYSALKSCGALIALLSEDFARSQWCFAEVALARLLGKPVFPIQLSQQIPRDGVFSSLQNIDLTQDPHEGYRRLLRGLQAAGLDPKDDFGWHVSESPYPGLRSFEAADAGVFFGRDEEIKSVLEALSRMRQLRDPRLALVLGASGSGKSSLVRAGVLPRLMKDPDRWFTLQPMRPGDEPFRALASVVAKAVEGQEDSPGRRIVQETLSEPPDKAASSLAFLLRDAAEAAGHADASAVLVIDQFEELFSASSENAASQFLQLLSEVLSLRGYSPLLVITLRSDFLGEFQHHPELIGKRFESIHVGPMPVRRFRELIERPAERTQPPLTFESGLVDRIVRDAGTNDALPLLAFTLGELYEHRTPAGSITLGSYLELGGIQGSVARVANALVADGQISAAEENALQAAFLRLVRINDEGQFARRPARRDELPAESQVLVDRFVNAHLLTSSAGDDAERLIEIAHESLFRVWDRLVEWLDEAREFLRWRNRFQVPFEQWLSAEKRSDALLVGAALTAAEAWRRERADGLSEKEREFIDRSVLQRTRTERRRRFAMYASLAAAASFLALSLWAVGQKLEAERQSEIALIRQLVADSNAISRTGLDWLRLKVLLAAESIVRSRNLEVDDSAPTELLRQHLALVPRIHGSFTVGRSTSVINDVAFNEDGTELIAASEYVDLHSRRWNFADETELPAIPVRGKVGSVALDPFGMYLTTAGDNGVEGTARVFEFATGRQIGGDIPYEASVGDMALSPNATFVALSDKLRSNRTMVWRVIDQTLVLEIDGSSRPRFSPDGTYFALGDSGSRTWSIETGDDGTERFVEETRARQPGIIDHVTAFSGDGRYIAQLGYSGVTVRRSGSGVEKDRLPAELSELSGRTLALGPAADYLAVAPSTSSGTTVLDVVRFEPYARVTINHPGQIQDLEFSPDGRFLAAATIGGNGVYTWELSSAGNRTRVTASRNPLQAAIDLDVGRLVALSEDSSVVEDVTRHRKLAAWDILSGESIDIPNQLLTSRNVMLSPDGRHIAVGSPEGVIVHQTDDGLPVTFGASIGSSASTAKFAFSSTGERLGIAADGVVRVFDVSARSELPPSEFEPFNYDGRASDVSHTAEGWILSVDIAPRLRAPDRPTRRRQPRHVPDNVTWNLRTGQSVSGLPQSSESLASDAQGKETIATSIDGRYHAIREEGIIVIHDRDEDLIAELCSLALGFEFTGEESEYYLGGTDPEHSCTGQAGIRIN